MTWRKGCIKLHGITIFRQLYRNACTDDFIKTTMKKMLQKYWKRACRRTMWNDRMCSDIRLPVHKPTGSDFDFCL